MLTLRKQLSRGLVINFEPAGVSIPKLIPQIRDLISGHRIGTGLQQGHKGVLNNLEVDLTQFVFFHGGTPDKAASVIGRQTVLLLRLAQKLRQLGDIRRDPPWPECS